MHLFRGGLQSQRRRAPLTLGLPRARRVGRRRRRGRPGGETRSQSTRRESGEGGPPPPPRPPLQPLPRGSACAPRAGCSGGGGGAAAERVAAWWPRWVQPTPAEEAGGGSGLGRAGIGAGLPCGGDAEGVGVGPRTRRRTRSVAGGPRTGGAGGAGGGQGAGGDPNGAQGGATHPPRGTGGAVGDTSPGGGQGGARTEAAGGGAKVAKWPEDEHRWNDSGRVALRWALRLHEHCRQSCRGPLGGEGGGADGVLAALATHSAANRHLQTGFVRPPRGVAVVAAVAASPATMLASFRLRSGLGDPKKKEAVPRSLKAARVVLVALVAVRYSGQASLAARLGSQRTRPSNWPAPPHPGAGWSSSFPCSALRQS
mmetsp:Transcript_31895/g.64911  ORF Transcript_31895/g.64911 Transcript_31895/m.64911 type:complete len:370 (-) Transcript_31895:218-1327(-)